MSMKEIEIDGLMLEDSAHDQLPSVEDYKAGAGYRKSHRPDPDGSSLSFMLPKEPESKNNEDSEDLETLQLVEDIDEYKKLHLIAAQKTRKWKTIALVCLGLSGIILVVVLVTRNGNNWMSDTARYAEIEKYIATTGISAIDALRNSDSPQHRAAKWLANKDGMKLAIPNSPVIGSHLTFVERYVLAVFYFATGGPGWTNQLNFLSDDHVCTWYESFLLDNDDSEVDEEYITLGVHGCKTIGKDLVPFTLFLPNNELTGYLPDEMRYLDRMEVLNLQFNGNLVGTLQTLTQMRKLRHVALQWCGLTGSIPSFIGALEDLKYLGLGNNYLTGAVPTEIIQLSNLELLGLDDNDLSANIELFHGLSNIKSLYLEDNKITGTISDALLVGWPGLEELDVSNNKLDGPLSDDLFGFQNLQVLDLSNNAFTGQMPTPKKDNLDLQFLALHGNRLDGAIPDGVMRLKGVTHLDMSFNSFSSTISETLGFLTQLEYLFLGTNDFQEGVIPPFLIQLTNLRELSLKSTRRSGTIPDFVNYMSNLQILDLHSNKLVGSLPRELGELTGLKHLLLKHNSLTGSLPTELGRLVNLDVLLLEQNNFVGNADGICQSSAEVQNFVADCDEEIECDCCTSCCSDGEPTCNPGDWALNVDPIWEYGYRRGRYAYDMGAHVVVYP